MPSLGTAGNVAALATWGKEQVTKLPAAFVPGRWVLVLAASDLPCFAAGYPCLKEE
jgi:hypothetical protein